MRYVFLAFFVFCQLALANLASAQQIDPNDLVLQRISAAKATKNVPVVKVNPAVQQRNPSKPILPGRASVAPAPVPTRPAIAPQAVRSVQVNPAVQQRNPSKPIVSGARVAPKASVVNINVQQRNPSKPIVDKAQEIKRIVKLPNAGKKLSEMQPTAQKTPTAAPRPRAAIKPVQKAVQNVSQAKPSASAAQKMEQIQTAAGEERKALSWFSTNATGQRMTITFNQRPNVTFEEAAGMVTFRFSAPAEYIIPQIPDNFRKNFLQIEDVSNGNLVIRVKFRADAKHQVSYNARRVFLDVITQDAAAQAPAAEQPVEPEQVKIVPPADAKMQAEQLANQKQAVVKGQEVKQPEVAKVEPVAETPAPAAAAEEPKKYVSYDKNITVIKDGDAESFEFKFGDKTDAALFERFGDYWLAFYTKDAIGLPDISRSDIFSDVVQLPNSNAVVYKFSMKKIAFAKAERNANSWKISFDPIVETPVPYPLKINKDGSEWYINVPGIDKSFDVKDEFTGEVLSVFPSQNTGEGFSDRMVYRDFVVEKSIQGIVLRKLSDASKVEYSSNQIRLTPAALPQKLFAEGDDVAEQKNGQALIDYTAIKRFEKAMQGNIYDMLRDMSPDGQGRILFAQKMYKEAAARLGALVGFDNAFLTIASYHLGGRYEKAAADLERLNLPDNKDKNEYLLWLIAAKHELAKQNPQFVDDAKIPKEFALPQNLKNYDDDVAMTLQLSVVEEALDENNLEFAELVVNNLPKTGNKRDLDYGQYLRARMNILKDRKERGLDVLAQLVDKTESREVRARAIFLKAETELEMKKISPEQALAVLDPARIIWRGDGFEYEFLTKVGDLFVENKKYQDALWAFKTAMLVIPEHPQNPQLIDKMRSVYLVALQRDFKDVEKSFEALTVYYDFLELKPTGREGEYLTIELAERLVGFDLLDQAIKVLEGFVVNVKDIEERALINTRVAILYYLDRKPELALAKLNKSEEANIPKYIDLQRRMLFVKLMTEKKQYDEALANISHMPAQKAIELRANVYWAKQDWENYLKNFETLVQPSDENIMRAAIAYAMLDNQQTLGSFYQANVEHMKAGQYADAFDFISRPNNLDYKNLAPSLNLEIAKKLAEEYKKDTNLGAFFKPKVAANAQVGQAAPVVK